MVSAIAFTWWLSSMSPPATLSPAPPPLEASSAPSPAAVGSARRVKPKLVTPAMIAAAQRFIKLPMGSERFATVGGKDYVFVLEHHYHPPGFVGGPVGDHKGVTMYELR
jgi:hypothetical protein